VWILIGEFEDVATRTACMIAGTGERSARTSTRVSTGVLWTCDAGLSPQQQLVIVVALPQSCCLVAQIGWLGAANDGTVAVAVIASSNANTDRIVRADFTMPATTAETVPATVARKLPWFCCESAACGLGSREFPGGPAGFSAPNCSVSRWHDSVMAPPPIR
jgi:hypothetical protein